jgi:hypothetical protein
VQIKACHHEKSHRCFAPMASQQVDILDAYLFFLVAFFFLVTFFFAFFFLAIFQSLHVR